MIHIELREKIIEAQEKRLTNNGIAKVCNCSDSTISRLLKQYRKSHDISSKTHLRVIKTHKV